MASQDVYKRQVNITVLAAGSIFTGTVHEPIKGTKIPQKMLQCGVPFTKKPVALQFDYKVKMSDRENRIRATGFSKITDAVSYTHLFQEQIEYQGLRLRLHHPKKLLKHSILS